MLLLNVASKLGLLIRSPLGIIRLAVTGVIGLAQHYGVVVATTFSRERATVVCVKTTPSRQMTKTLLLSLKKTQVIRRLYGSSLVLSPGYEWRSFYFSEGFMKYLFLILQQLSRYCQENTFLSLFYSVQFVSMQD